MAMSTCLCKSAIGILNVIVMLTGIAVAVIGVLLQVAAGSTIFTFLEDSIKKILKSDAIGILDDSNFVDTIKFQELFEPASVILIVVGLFIACVAFLGFCGASCNYRIILILYTIVLGVLILAQIIIAIVFFEHALDSELKKQAKRTIDDEYVAIDDSSPASVVWNVIMIRFQCCGLENYKDFDTAQKWKRTRQLTIDETSAEYNLSTPLACCTSNATFPDVRFLDDWCAVKPMSNTSNQNTGCWGEVSTFLEPHRTPAILVISAIIVVEAAVMLITIIILKSEESSVCPG